MGKSTFLQDFKAFAMKGNVIDMAVGVVIGGAFGKIVSSLVANVIMPPIGLLVGGVNFTDLKWVMKAAEVGADGKEIAPAVSLDYGQFLQATFAFSVNLLTSFTSSFLRSSVSGGKTSLITLPSSDGLTPKLAASIAFDIGFTCEISQTEINSILASGTEILLIWFNGV